MGEPSLSITNPQLAGMFLGDRRPDWRTPQSVYDQLDAEFGFVLDAASDEYNFLSAKRLTANDNALWHSWAPGPVFVNPPYGRAIWQWTSKARLEQAAGVTVVMLLPARTDTEWFHRDALGHAEIRFIRGRLRFGGDHRFGHNAPFPSMVVIWQPEQQP